MIEDKFNITLFREFFSIIKFLNEKNIDYAVIGGIALAFYDEPRFTKDIDILVFPENMEQIAGEMKNLGYFQSAPAWTFKETNLTLYRFMKISHPDEFVIDFLVANSKEHKKIMKNTILEKSYVGDVKIASNKDLIKLKQARNSDQDKVDIKKLKKK